MEIDNTAYTILVIDDDAPSLKALLNHLQGLGFKTLAARSGERGLDVARRSKPDLILLDVLMPGIDGFETCRRLKENEAIKNIPVIFLTALTDTAEKIKGFEAGAVDYITKPIQNQEVSARINTHLRLHELTERLEQKVQEQTRELIAEITERKQAEALLRKSEEKYRQLIENANESIAVAQDGMLKLFNPKLLDLTGYSQAEVASQPFTNFIHPDDREMVAECYLQRLQGEQSTDEAYAFRIINKGGDVRWVETKAVSINWEGKPAALTFLSDVTERLQTEEEIRRQNLELTLLNRVIAATATGPDAETILGLVCQELALAFDMPQASATLWSEEKLKATIVAEYRSGEQPTILDQDIPLKDNPIVQYLRANKTPLAVEDAQNDPRLALVHELLRQRGTVSLLVMPLIIEQEVIGSLNIEAAEPRSFLDEEISLAQRVTEQVAGTLTRIRLDEQHRQLEDQLRQSQKMEAIGRLAGGLAHDFNNLLTVITGYSELLLNHQVDENDPQGRDVKQIRKAAERGSTLTRQLLAFSRQHVIQPEILDLNIIITNLNKMLRRLVSEDIELITHLYPSLGYIRVDPGQMEQIIMNLVVNAADAMPQGGKLTIETTNVDVDVNYANRHIGLEPGAYVILSISDTGIGMDEETRSRIFEPFFTTKEKDKGTGLGLAMVYGIVQQNEGYISVTSQLRQGATFQIYLPCFEQTPELTYEEQTPAESPQGTETILLVEDEDMVRDLTCYTLRQNGYNVLEARHGQEALNIVGGQHEELIHLLLTDVVMPSGLNGPDLAKQVTSFCPEIKVLYMSGYVDDEIAQRGILNPDIAFIQKPFSPIALLRKVREVLDA